MGISHHRRDPIFATCGDTCQLWEETRNEPIRTFKWGVDSLHDVKYNPVETNLLGEVMTLYISKKYIWIHQQYYLIIF